MILGWARAPRCRGRSDQLAWSVAELSFSALACMLGSQTGLLNRRARLLFGCICPGPRRHWRTATRAELRPYEGSHVRVRTVATSTVAGREGVSAMSPRWPRAFRRGGQVLMGCLRPLRWPTARPDPAAGSRLCTTAHCSTNSYKNGTNASKYHKRRSRNENEYTARTLR
jgi:hypothetical protein